MTAEVTDWKAQAACRGTPPGMFFPEWDGRTGATRKFQAAVEEAVAVCRGCPVRDECFSYALDHDLSGVWGGYYLHERDGVPWPSLNPWTRLVDGVPELPQYGPGSSGPDWPGLNRALARSAVSQLGVNPSTPTIEQYAEEVLSRGSGDSTERKVWATLTIRHRRHRRQRRQPV